MTDSLTNEYHAALIKVHDIARNGTHDTAAWREVLQVVAVALDLGREHQQSKRWRTGIN